MAKRVEVILSPDGSIKTEAFEFSGSGCMEKSKWVFDLFGEPDRTDHKEEYYQEEMNEISNGLCG